MSRVASMEGLFYAASSFNQDVGGWQTWRCTDTSFTFSYAKAFNHDVSAWDGKSVNE